MNDQELADKVVALGVGKHTEQGIFDYWSAWPVNGPNDARTDAEFVRDWRVAGALMEKLVECQLEWWVGSGDGLMHLCFVGVRDDKEYRASGKSLPRAIIEACVEALS